MKYGRILIIKQGFHQTGINEQLKNDKEEQSWSFSETTKTKIINYLQIKGDLENVHMFTLLASFESSEPA